MDRKNIRTNTASRSSGRKHPAVSLSSFVPKPPGISPPTPIICGVKPKLLILRGAPGSGKTTLAEKMFPTWEHICADDYFTQRDGTYIFDASLLQTSHDVCFKRTGNALRQGKNVVVHNTFRTLSELNRYHEFSKISDARIFRVVSQFKSKHQIPDSIMYRHLHQYEPSPVEKQVRLDIDNPVCPKIIFCEGENKPPVLKDSSTNGDKIHVR